MPKKPIKNAVSNTEEVEKQIRIEERLKKEAEEFKKEFTDRLFKLITSGFGLVSALAWNEVIKESVNSYIKPLLGESSGLISLIIYALAVTLLAVLVTYQISKFSGDK